MSWQPFAAPRFQTIPALHLHPLTMKIAEHRLQVPLDVGVEHPPALTRDVVEEILAEGASVVVADINPAGARDTVKAITDAGGSAVAQEADIASESSVKSMVQAALDNFGRLDLLH